MEAVDEGGEDGVIVNVVDELKLEVEQSHVSVIHQPCPIAEMTAPQPLAEVLRLSKSLDSG